MTRRIAAVTFLALAACAPKQETPEQMAARMKAESDSAKAAIEALQGRFLQYVAAGKADSAASVYAEDAVFSYGNGPEAKGRQAIQTMLTQMFSYGTWQITGTTLRVDVNGPLAVEQGAYVENFKAGPHAPAGMQAAFPDTGQYLTELRKVNGAWLIAADFGNSGRAAPAPSAKKH